MIKFLKTNAVPISLFILIILPAMGAFILPWLFHWLSSNRIAITIPYTIISLSAIAIIAINSNIISKIGGVLCVIYWLLNWLGYHDSCSFEDTYWFYQYENYDMVLVLDAIFILGYILLTWGTRLWLIIKIIYTIAILLIPVKDIIYCHIRLTEDLGEYPADLMNTNILISLFSIFLFIVTLHLLIAYIFTRKSPPRYNPTRYLRNHPSQTPPPTPPQLNTNK